MTAADWVGLVAASYVGAVIGLVRRGGRLQRAQDSRIVCPRLHVPVACRIVQDVRLGRWTSVESCSVFGDSGELLCDQECVRLLNLGRRLSSAAN